jgi:hypothetical protein
VAQHSSNFVEGRRADLFQPLGDRRRVQFAPRLPLVEGGVNPRMEVKPDVMLSQRTGAHCLELVLLGPSQKEQQFGERRGRIEPQLVVQHDLPSLVRGNHEAFSMRDAADERGQIDLVANHAADDARRDRKRGRIGIANRALDGSQRRQGRQGRLGRRHRLSRKDRFRHFLHHTPSRRDSPDCRQTWDAIRARIIPRPS